MLKVSKQEIKEALLKVISPKDEIILLHSNVFSFGKMDSPLEEILSAVLEALSPQQTLIMPTFTFSFCKSGQYHYLNTPSETGALTEYFRKLPGVIRTKCPINSFAAKGPRAKELLSWAESKTCWGKGSVYQFLYDHNVLVVGLGEKLSMKSSIFHCSEEQNLVPYRYFKAFKGTADFGQGEGPVSKEMFVRRLDVPVIYDYAPAIDKLAAKAQFSRVSLGSSFVEALRAREAIDTLNELIAEDPLAVLSSRVEYLKQMALPTISFLGSSNLDLLTKTFLESYSNVTGKNCRLIPVAFNQYKQQILDEASSLRVVNPDYIVFIERIEDLLGTSLTLGNGQKDFKGQVSQAIHHYVGFIKQARAVLKGRFIVANFESVTPSAFGNIDWKMENGLQGVVDSANRLLEESIRDLPDVHLLNFRLLAHRYGTQNAFSRRYWYLGKIPFTNDFSKLLSNSIVGLMLSMDGRTSRLIIVDLDNTLWGGVVGDDGPEGIKLGGDYPGNVYKDFQIFLKALAQRGIALAICSKNNEDTVFKAMEEHPDMILKKTDFVAHRINWDDKAKNIRSICQELSLGTYSAMFLDDNPVEREYVKRNIPDCIVPGMPNNISEWMDFLAQHPFLQAHQLTTEDLKRSQQYAQINKVEELKQMFTNIDDFFGSLEMRVEMEEYGPSNKSRIQQLISKTNQFNTTTQRYSEQDLNRLLEAEGSGIWAVYYQDKFFEREIIGVVIVKPVLNPSETVVIDSFILSCRILGRNIETAILGWLTQRLRERGAKKILGAVIPTDKNKPAQSLYAGQGFMMGPDRAYVLDLGLQQPIQIPKYIAVAERSAVKVHG